MSHSTEQATLKPTTFTGCAPNAERVALVVNPIRNTARVNRG